MLFGNATETDKANVEKLGQSLKKMAKIKSTTVLENSDDKPPALSALAGTLEVMVPMAGVVDVEKELTRLDKELERMKTEQVRISAKLANQNFVDRSPQAVVDKEKLKLE